MLDKYDGLMLRFADRTSWFWKHITGKDTLQFARFLVHFGFVLCIFKSIITIILGLVTGGILIPLLYLWVMKIIWDTREECLDMIQTLEDHTSSGETDVIPFTVIQIHKSLYNARCWTIFGIFLVGLDIGTFYWFGLVYAVGIFCLGFSQYAMTSPPGKKQTVWSKVKEKIKNLATSTKEKAKDLIPAPIPAPVPISRMNSG